MAKKNTTTKVDAPTSSEPVSRTPTPTPAPSDSANLTTDAVTTGVHGQAEQLENDRPGLMEESIVADTSGRTSQEIPALILPGDSVSERVSKDSTSQSKEDPSLRPSTEEVDALLLQAQLEHEDVKTKMQEEISGYIERIDALNAKLQYLAKEAALSAKQAATEVEPASLEKKLLEKEAKIALLMEEGQKLSMGEMKHLSTIKKLRAQAATSSKDQEAVRQRIERAERTITILDDKAKKAESNAKNAESKLNEAVKQTRDLEAMTKERNALNETLTEMKTQVTKANARAENAESKAQSEQLEVERKRIVELQDDLSSAKVEREIGEEKLRREVRDLKSTLEREKEQTRSMETEMLAEQAALESRLESFRVRAEEASSNDQGDAQAKLLRQIETLQSQYAAASQNWQGIEGSLLTRITALEKERDDLTVREADLRKKLREATSKAKSNEKELEELQLKHATVQETQSDMQTENNRLSKKTEQLEEDLVKAQKEIEDQKTKMERDFARRLDEEKARWAASVQLTRLDSPTGSTRKTSIYDNNHLMHPPHADRPTSRKSSPFIPQFSGVDAISPMRQHSHTSFKGLYNGIIPETPSIVTSADNDDYFAGTPASPASPDPTQSRRGIPELISTSTVGAGPSVQLVERMSANVRRLESEKAASKDELARLTTQRDESRQEVVRLMREADQKKKVEQRLKELEDEHRVLSERYQTTLELLGEKSEQVEELKADIQDVKQMYRELADHMK